jgi:methylated-DNA-[protein]-cysteine S-methyltransferase
MIDRPRHAPAPHDDAFTVSHPVTSLTVVMTAGVVTRVTFGGARRAAASAAEGLAEQELLEYLGGRRTTFTFPTAAQGTPFERTVWRVASDIAYGATMTYGEVARAVGQPGSARAVGLALGKNPLPIVVPCHRVVAGGGRLGGFGGGAARKRRLLALEERSRPAGLPAAGAQRSLFAALLLVGGLSCSDPQRPTFGPGDGAPDTEPPRIEFLAPPPNSVFAAGSQVVVRVRVTDESTLAEVLAAVAGAVSVGFPIIDPGTTELEVDFPIATSVGMTGTATFVVTAIDASDNEASATRSFMLQ